MSRKLDNITNVMLFDLASTVNQAVTTRVVFLTGCKGWSCRSYKVNYLITGYLKINNKGDCNMPERCNAKVNMVGRIIIPFLFLISLVLHSQIAFADEKSHYDAARQLVDLTYNEDLTYETAKKFALLAAKDKFENNPKFKDYSEVLINLTMEIIDAGLHDIETQNKIKMEYAKVFMEEFTEHELKEFIKFYRTAVGQKALHKLPIVMQKSWERGSEIGNQVFSLPKYEQMFTEKFKALQVKGILPQEFK